MRERLRPSRPDFRLDQMFETHSDEWERVGLFVAAIVIYDNYESWFHLLNKQGNAIHPGVVTAVQIATVVVLLALGWALARDIGRIAGPTFFRRMDPGTAGTVGFITRLVTVGIVVLVVLRVAGVSATSIVAGSA